MPDWPNLKISYGAANVAPGRNSSFIFFVGNGEVGLRTLNKTGAGFNALHSTPLKK
jgi:hypothetical protein